MLASASQMVPVGLLLSLPIARVHKSIEMSLLRTPLMTQYVAAGETGQEEKPDFFAMGESIRSG